MALIGISGKKGSGKDTVGKIIQYLLINPNNEHYDNFEDFLEYYEDGLEEYPYSIEKFSEKVSDIFEQFTGIKFHSLDRDEKEKVRPLYDDFAQGQKKIFGEDVWVNALFSKYHLKLGEDSGGGIYSREVIYPKWIITDLRFPNERRAILEKEGLTIRVLRDLHRGDAHIAPIPTDPEIALDNAKFDYTIDNNCSMNTLIESVKEILIKEKIIKNEIQA